MVHTEDPPCSFDGTQKYTDTDQDLMKELIQQFSNNHFTVDELVFLLLCPAVYDKDVPNMLWARSFTGNVYNAILRAYKTDPYALSASEVVKTYKDALVVFAASDFSDDFTRHPLFKLAVKRFHMVNTIVSVDPWDSDVASWDALDLIYYCCSVILDGIERNYESENLDTED